MLPIKPVAKGYKKKCPGSILTCHNPAKVEDGDEDRQRRQTQPGMNTAVQSESTTRTHFSWWLPWLRPHEAVQLDKFGKHSIYLTVTASSFAGNLKKYKLPGCTWIRPGYRFIMNITKLALSLHALHCMHSCKLLWIRAFAECCKYKCKSSINVNLWRVEFGVNFTITTWCFCILSIVLTKLLWVTFGYWTSMNDKAVVAVIIIKK